MSKIIVTTEEELRNIILDCISQNNANETPIVPSQENKQLHSIADLSKFLKCSIASAQKIKNSGRIRYVQFGRKLIFNTQDILEDLQSGNNTDNYKRK
ncbi:MAG: hypothetical protein CVU05_06015 [Bacteroidetes bacterium HGW-Bacteroidetes-21]|jgi:hypothetical protein|nr:MAG: hypothetical protein CVU05_06015 [Bacteroidetes bacterium HGW-Bacteroidetes-21]